LQEQVVGLVLEPPLAQGHIASTFL
jgi:hypothetical protein